MREFYRILGSLLFLTVFVLSAAGFSVPTAEEERQNQIIRWKKPVISIAVSASLTKTNTSIREGSDVAGAIRRSLEVWEKVAAVRFDEVSTDKQTISPSGSAGDGVSLITVAPSAENLLLFSKDAQEAAARTRVFFNRKGVISEADIVLNPYQQFSTDGSVGTFDLESILTHEIGHLLGLEHSSILGATMHESSGKNGVYNLSAFNSRTLAETDIAAVRSIYGGSSATENCCGSISGKLLSGNQKNLKNYHIWAEEAESGKLAAESFAAADGVFELNGLPSGSYRLIAQNLFESKFSAAEELGIVEVSSGKSATMTRKLTQSTINFQAQHIGFNGQLAESAVSLNAGKSYRIYLGGKNLHAEDFALSFNSPFISVIPKTAAKLDFSRDISAYSFDVLVASGAPNGEYSLTVESKSGQKSIIPGAVSVESFSNPWSILTLDRE